MCSTEELLVKYGIISVQSKLNAMNTSVDRA